MTVRGSLGFFRGADLGAAMAKKKVAKVNATKTESPSKPVRLVLRPSEHARLERLTDSLGMSMSTYARMVLLRSLKEDEAKESQ
jgi:hypothetical protein